MGLSQQQQQQNYLSYSKCNNLNETVCFPESVEYKKM